MPGGSERIVPALSRERVKARLDATDNLGRERDEALAIIDDLLAEVADLRAAVEPKTTYRLVAEFGGWPVRIVADHTVNGAQVAEVNILAPQADGDASLYVSRDAIEEVRPPSIDDPVSLPLRIEHRTNALELGEEPGHAKLRLRVKGSRDSIGLALALDPVEMRSIARALWQRANEADAQP